MFEEFQRKQIAELRPWQPGDDMSGVSVAEVDAAAGSPKDGDMIARNPKNHEDQWLVAAAYFADNFDRAGKDEPAPLAIAQPVAEPIWMDTARKVEQRKYAETVSSALRLDEAAFIILNVEGQIERKAVEREMALEFARDRVDQTGQLKIVYMRVAVVRHRNTTDYVSVE